MNQFQSIQSGKAELKDYYSDGSRKEAVAEAIRRRRRKMMDKRMLVEEDDKDRQVQQKP